MAQEIYVITVLVIVVAAIVYYLTSTRKKVKEVVTNEVSIQEAPKEEIKPEVAAPVQLELTRVRGIGPKWSEKLKAVGIDDVRELAKCDPKNLAENVGVSEKITSRWVKNANELLSLSNPE
ncbi:MAG: helix-hairpin-helix domain-containing protein [Candidatus Bathyarchaeia archaeon]